MHEELGSTPILSRTLSWSTWERCGMCGPTGCTRPRCIGSFTRARTIGYREFLVLNPSQIPVADLVLLLPHSIPFFYEPNFDAVIKVSRLAFAARRSSLTFLSSLQPLPSALALQVSQKNSEAPPPLAPPVVYGDFLAKKVSGNFAES